VFETKLFGKADYTSRDSSYQTLFWVCRHRRIFNPHPDVRMTDFVYLASKPATGAVVSQLTACLMSCSWPTSMGTQNPGSMLPSRSLQVTQTRDGAQTFGAAVARRPQRGVADTPVVCSDLTVAVGRLIYSKPRRRRCTDDVGGIVRSDASRC
jgi:septum formation protein